MFRIVIVEDEPPIVRSIKEKIANADRDFRVVGEYGNGEAALLELDIVKPHVLITDLRMPVMDGMTLLERVRERYPEIVCVILSGYADFEYTRTAIRRGVSDYLLKPPTAESIGELLAAAKEQLLRNEPMIEAEILRRLVFPDRRDGDGDTVPERLAKEYFYHAHYALLYGWIPPELQREGPGRRLAELAARLLRDGERQYAIASQAHEGIVLLGLHDGRDERLAEWKARLEREGGLGTASVAIAPAGGGIANVPRRLVRARKAAIACNRADRLAVVIADADELAAGARRVELPQDALGHLAAFWRKMKPKEFEAQLVSAIAACRLEEQPREAWIRAMRPLVRWLEEQAPPAIAADKARSAEEEIEAAVWSASDTADMTGRLKRIFGGLFPDGEPEPAAGWLDELEAYLRRNYTANLTLADLSAKFGLNPSYLSYVFKSKKGKSPIDFMIELRVEEAMRLIREFPRLLFKDVAEQVGCPDPYYFSKLFKQWTGRTPTEYKREQS